MAEAQKKSPRICESKTKRLRYPTSGAKTLPEKFKEWGLKVKVG